MKKNILSLALIITSGFFFAGFSQSVVFAAQTPEELTQELAENKCKQATELVVKFEADKEKHDFDFSQLAYEKEAYQQELEAYIALERAVLCLSEKGACDTTKFGNKISAQGMCRDNSAERIEITDNLKKLEYASQQFENSARLFQRAERLYFGSRHLSLAREQYIDGGTVRDDSRSLDSIMTDNIITRAGGGFFYSTEESIRNVFSGEDSIIKPVNRFLGSLAILYLFVLGAKFILARGDSEKLSSLKGEFAWIILGLAIISLAEFIGYEVFDPSGSNDIFEGNAQRSFRAKIMQVIRFFEYMAGGLMLINALISAYGLIVSGEDEESVSKEKQFIKSFLLGTGFILLAEVIVRILSFQENTSLEETTGIAIAEIAGIINFVLSFIGIIAVAMLIIAGMYYVVSFGDEEQMGRAKKIIINSLIGVIISFSAYAIVTFLIV